MHFFRNVDEDVWWDVVQECEYATFFHTPLWHRLAIQTYPNYCDDTIGVELESGVRVIFPLLEMNSFKGYFRDLVSTFAGSYGDLIADGPIEDKERQHIYETVCSRKTVRLQVTGNPMNKEVNPWKGFTQRNDFTHILSLTPNFDALFSNFSKGHKSSYKKGLRMGVTVRVANTIDDYRTYFGAYQDSLRRWGDSATSRYPWTLFENGFHLAQIHPENIKLWLAEVEGKVIAGAWVFYWGQHASWWHGATYEAYFNYYPNNVLQSVITRNALEKGCKYYDFNPSGGHSNVARFKGRFGATQWPVVTWKHEKLIFRLMRNIKNTLTW